MINSCHLIATFPTVVDGTPRHQGVLTAQEAPEIIHGVPYDYPGDYELAARLIARGKAAGQQCVLANDVHYPLDYGTVMPMVCYLDPAQTLPMVPVSVCLSADLEESYQLGALHRPGGRARAASAWASWPAAASPTSWCEDPRRARRPEDQALDHRFAKLLAGGEYDKLWAWLPEFARTTQAEMGGRHLAMLLGAVMESGQPLRGPPCTPTGPPRAAATT